MSKICLVKSSLFTTQPQLSLTLRKEALENTVEKGENAGIHSTTLIKRNHHFNNI